ncbi:MAG TPA: hypothetical protein VJ583_03465 [Nitrososphaeraceae archaeon]|nr:hypothetical protein [Nitrososphaeraceae archaeon]
MTSRRNMGNTGRYTSHGVVSVKPSVNKEAGDGISSNFVSFIVFIALMLCLYGAATLLF